MEFSCPFRVKTSHSIENFDSKSSKAIEFNIPLNVTNIVVFDKRLETLEIKSLSTNYYKLTISSNDILTTEQAVGFLEVFGKIFGFLINEDEQNSHYGTHFIDFELYNFKQKRSKSILQVSMKLTIHSSRKIQVLPADFSRLHEHVLLEYYNAGLRAESSVAKFFYWFLMLEYLETSKQYKDLNSGEPLFSKEEIAAITNFAKSMADSKKRGALLQLKSYSLKSRVEKLNAFLNDIGHL